MFTVMLSKRKYKVVCSESVFRKCVPNSTAFFPSCISIHLPAIPMEGTNKRARCSDTSEKKKKAPAKDDTDTISNEGDEDTAVEDDTNNAASAALGSIEDMDSNVIVCMRTFKTQQWRTLVDALKDLVPEVPITFGPDGLKLVSMDPAHIALIHLHAKSEFYYCKETTVTGLHMNTLYKMLRNLTTGGYQLELSILADDADHLQVIITNNEKRTCIRNRLRLLRLRQDVITIPPTTFSRVLSIPSGDFQRYIRELSGLSNNIKVQSTRDKFILSASGTSGSSSIEIRPTASGMHWLHIDNNDGREPNDDVIEGVFLSKYLERFARPLGASCEIYIKQNYPLVLRYKLTTAVVRLVISQSVVDDDEEK